MSFVKDANFSWAEMYTSIRRVQWDRHRPNDDEDDDDTSSQSNYSRLRNGSTRSRTVTSIPLVRLVVDLSFYKLQHMLYDTITNEQQIEASGVRGFSRTQNLWTDGVIVSRLGSAAWIPDKTRHRTQWRASVTELGYAPVAIGCTINGTC